MVDTTSSERERAHVFFGELQNSFVHWFVVLAESLVLWLALNSSSQGVCPPGQVGFEQDKNLGCKE